MNMIEFVVIGNNECKHLDEVITSIKSLGVIDSHIHYIADRCTDETINKLSSYKVDWVDTSNLNFTGRCTSSCRNLGLSRCNPESDVIFLDGDRSIISHGPMEFKADVALFRVSKLDYRTKGSVVARYGTFGSQFYSAGMYMSRESINKVIEFQGELFPTDIQDEWGIEDTYLGDVCYHLGISIEFRDDFVLNGSLTHKNISRSAMIKRLAKRKLLNVLRY